MRQALWGDRFPSKVVAKQQRGLAEVCNAAMLSIVRSRKALFVTLLIAGLAPLEQSCATMPASGVSPYYGAPAGGLGSASGTGGGFGQNSSGAALESENFSSQGLSSTRTSSGTDRLPVISGTLDQQSQEITNYLQHHRLPLVQAEVRRDVTGQREVVLYGFVASPFGKADAEAKVRKLLGKPDILIINEIKVRPQLLRLGHSTGNQEQNMAQSLTSSTAQSVANSAYPLNPNPPVPVGSASAYQSQSSSSSSSSWLSYALPLLAIGGMIGLSFIGGGGAGFMPGFYPGYYPFFP